MATTNQNFVLNNYQGTLNSATFTAIPFLDTFERKAALQLTGRSAGGPAGASDSISLQPPWIVNSKGIIMLDDIISSFDNDGLAKHGFFHVTLSGTTAVNVNLTNLVTNATTQMGDAVFATINKLVFFNLTGLDGVTAANMTITQGASNPAPLGLTGTTPAYTLPASSPWGWFSKAGGAITGSAKIITVTPAAGGNFVLGVAGA